MLVGVVLGWGLDSQLWTADSDVNGTAQTLTEAYRTIHTQYVDPVPSETLTAHAIKGLVGALDPHSTYLDRERMERARESFEGSFEGIGVSYERLEGPKGQDTIFVATVVAGGPSDKAGLRAGDRIVAVEDTSSIGWTDTRIRSRLTGPEGTKVQVKVRRPGRDSPFETTIVRDQVPLHTLEAAYMIDDRTGYLRLQRFAGTTHQEFTRELQRLKKEGMTRLLLDLRGNAGGLMSQAEQVADEFLVEGQLIVSARSEHNDYSTARYATDEGAYEEGALIVLVDGQSASASEIIAGALQDHDRALLVGTRTYGKGLVQRQFDFDDGSGLRLTIARFYTPSGRLLQRPYDTSFPSDSVSGRVSDSSPTSGRPDTITYRTDAGRRVLGGGGIQPDVTVSQTTSDDHYRSSVERQGLIRSFARSWIDRRADSLRSQWSNRPDAFFGAFTVPSSVVPAFTHYAAAHGVPAPTRPVVIAGEHEGGSPPEGSSALPSSFHRYLRVIIKSHVGRRLFGTSMSIRVRNTVDPMVSKALESWERATALSSQYPVQ